MQLWFTDNIDLRNWNIKNFNLLRLILVLNIVGLLNMYYDIKIIEYNWIHITRPNLNLYSSATMIYTLKNSFYDLTTKQFSLVGY